MKKRDELKRDLADRDWWREVAKALGVGVILIGWTYRESALFSRGLGVGTLECDGDLAERILRLRGEKEGEEEET